MSEQVFLTLRLVLNGDPGVEGVVTRRTSDTGDSGRVEFRNGEGSGDEVRLTKENQETLTGQWDGRGTETAHLGRHDRRRA